MSLQQAFLEEQAGQCGYCLSGIIISAKALLDRNPEPSRAEIVTALDKHLCRCGTHPRIIAPSQKAARWELSHGAPAMSDTLPLSIVNNRRLDKWLRFQPDRTVKLAVGKVEIGQGVLIALTQIAAEELDVALDRFDILSGDTAGRAGRGFDQFQPVDRGVGPFRSAGHRGAARADARPAGATAELRAGRPHGRRRRSSCRTATRPATTTGTSPAPRISPTTSTGTARTETALGLQGRGTAGARGAT